MDVVYSPSWDWRYIKSDTTWTKRITGAPAVREAPPGVAWRLIILIVRHRIGTTESLYHVVRTPWRRIGHAAHFGATRLFSWTACFDRNIAPLYPLIVALDARDVVRFWTWLTIARCPFVDPLRNPSQIYEAAVVQEATWSSRSCRPVTSVPCVHPLSHRSDAIV